MCVFAIINAFVFFSQITERQHFFFTLLGGFDEILSATAKLSGHVNSILSVIIIDDFLHNLVTLFSLD